MKEELLIRAQEREPLILVYARVDATHRGPVGCSRLESDRCLPSFVLHTSCNIGRLRLSSEVGDRNLIGERIK